MNINKFDFVRDGAIRLPPGFRFQPTDEELVFQYLKRKVYSCPLPASIIPEINVCKYDPWDLPGDLEQERYFFSRKEAKHKRVNRATGSGYWKANGSDKQIGPARRNNMGIGMKKTLVFYIGKPRNGTRTDWVMHEYRLVPPCNDHCLARMDSWVVCRVFLKNSTRNYVVKSPRLVDFMLMAEKTSSVPVSLSLSSSSASSSSSCSDITEVSSSGRAHEDHSQ